MTSFSITKNINTPPPPPSSELPKIPPTLQGSLNLQTATASQLVVFYSKVYAYWDAQVQACKSSGDTSSAIYQWAAYYSDLSSRAAHHYNDLKDSRSGVLDNSPAHSLKSVVPGAAPAPASSVVAGPPLTFQDYAHRCMRQCVTETQRTAMKEMIEMTIRKSLQDGSLHVKNWTVEPLLPLYYASTPGTTISSTNMSIGATVTNTTAGPATAAGKKSYASVVVTNSRIDDLNSPKTDRVSKHHGSASAGTGATGGTGGHVSTGTSVTAARDHGYDSLKINHSKASSSNKRKQASISFATAAAADTSSNTSDTFSYYGPCSSKTIQEKEGGPMHVSHLKNYDDIATATPSAGDRGGDLTGSSSFVAYSYSQQTSMDLNGSASSNPTWTHDHVDDDWDRDRSSRSYNMDKKKIKKMKKQYSRTKDSNHYDYNQSQGTGTGTDSNFDSSSSFLASEPDYISLSRTTPSSPPSFVSSTANHPSKRKKSLGGTQSTTGSASASTSVHLQTPSSKRYKVESRTQHKDGFDVSASMLASRANRFSGRGGLTTATSNELHQEYSRGVEKYMGKTVIGGGTKLGLDEKDYERMTVRGTCQVLEKEFLRLTAPPRAELVRPQPVLEQHLENILALRKRIKYGKKGTYYGVNENHVGDDGKDYNWFCSQLKAIRQDMTVQRIFNAFAVKVYEAHARIALEEGDMNEYNQSQTQLKELYEQLSHHHHDSDHMNGSSSGDKEGNGLENRNEFIAYRIIYHVFLTGNKKYQGGSSDLFKIMLHLTSEQRSDPLIIHALKVRVAVADNDYHAFFRLYNQCSNHGGYLMEKIIPQIRSSALRCMMKAYRPTVSTDFVLSELGFDTDCKNQMREALDWLKNCGCKFTDHGTMVDVKESNLLDETILAGAQKSSLI